MYLFVNYNYLLFQEHDQLSSIDRWIVTKFVQLANLCDKSFQTYDLHYAARQIEKFWVNELCDVYLESIKWDIMEKHDDYLQSLNLLIVLTHKTLQLMHPFMPFITENLHQHLEYALSKVLSNEYKYQSILQLGYPSPKEDNLMKHFDHSYMDDYEKVFAIRRKIRWFKQNFFINREPLIESIRIASLSSSLIDYQKMISSSIKMDDCQLEFVDLYDIYKFNDCYCVQIDLNDETEDESSTPSSAGSSDSSSNESRVKSNSLLSDEIYILFSVDKNKLENRLHDTKLNLKDGKIASLLGELEQLHSSRFSENYKKITKIIS